MNDQRLGYFSLASRVMPQSTSDAPRVNRCEVKRGAVQSLFEVGVFKYDETFANRNGKTSYQLD